MSQLRQRMVEGLSCAVLQKRRKIDPRLLSFSPIFLG